MTESLHAKARRHFLAHREILDCVHVPEWDADVYFYAHLSHEERAAIAKHMTLVGTMGADYVVTSLIYRARKEDGTRIWSETARRQLETEVDPLVMERLVDAMNEKTVALMEGEERKKN